MGCCGSTQAGSDGQTPSQPTRAEAPPTTSLTSTLSPFTSSTSRAPVPRPSHIGHSSQSRSRSSPSDPPRRPPSSAETSPASRDRYTVPLSRPRSFNSTDRTWTPNQLSRERAEFFDTRVTNRREIWWALQNVCELLRGGDLATAQGILDASGCTLPTGNLADGCYDEVGNLYRLPQHVISDPLNMEKDDETEEGREEGEVLDSSNSNNIDGATMIGVAEPKAGGTAGDKDLDDEDGKVGKDDFEMLERRREEKGKGNERDTVKVRCRLSDRGGPDVTVAVGKTEHVATVARRVQIEGKIPPGDHVRLAYLGRVLDGKDTLEAQGWKLGHVINALVIGA